MQVDITPEGKPHPFAKYPDKPVRTTCLQCGVKMDAHLKTAEGWPVRSTSLAIMDPEGHFDQLRCAAKFGVAIAKERTR